MNKENFDNEYYESFEWLWDKYDKKQKENKMVKKAKAVHMLKVNKLKEIMNEYLSHWELSELDKSMIAINYVEKFGVKDMEAFIKFFKGNNREDDIMPTIAHDINGMNGDYFLPRTSGYHARTK